FWRAFGRELFGNVISGQILYLGYLWMIWDKDRQTWHDKVAGTIVVKV
ncbi:MAG: RDD family protein, partial [Actinomycetota bacterium]|nr:RDD family protein [Actinomycetota bacterium]